MKESLWDILLEKNNFVVLYHTIVVFRYVMDTSILENWVDSSYFFIISLWIMNLTKALMNHLRNQITFVSRPS